jgi:hypothetical protein
LLAVSHRQLVSVGTSILAPEVDGLPLLTRLLLFAANGGGSLANVCSVAMIDDDIIRCEADRLSQMGVIDLCGATGRLGLNDRRGRRLWNDFNCVREFRKGRHHMVFDPVARALRWVNPSDLIRVYEGAAPLLPERHRVELAKVPDEVLADLIEEVSPELANIFAEREDRPVDVSLGPTAGTLTSSLRLPAEMVILPRPHTAVDPGVWRDRTDFPPPQPNDLYSIDGPALRFEVKVGREGQQGRDTVIYLFDQVTGVIHKEKDIEEYVQCAPVGPETASVFVLPPKHTGAELCEALASGLLGHLLPERGRRCREAGWLIGEEAVTLRRGATEIAIAECAVRQAKEEGGWHFWTSATVAQNSVRGE